MSIAGAPATSSLLQGLPVHTKHESYSKQSVNDDSAQGDSTSFAVRLIPGLLCKWAGAVAFWEILGTFLKGDLKGERSDKSLFWRKKGVIGFIEPLMVFPYINRHDLFTPISNKVIDIYDGDVSIYCMYFVFYILMYGWKTWWGGGTKTLTE